MHRSLDPPWDCARLDGPQHIRLAGVREQHPVLCGHLAALLNELALSQRQRVIGSFVERLRLHPPSEAALRALGDIAEADRLRAALSHPSEQVRRAARARQIERGTVI